MRPTGVRLVLLATLSFMAVTGGSARTPPAAIPAFRHPLTFEERVEAQRTIERLYYAHQTGATLPFDAAVPRELLEKKVRNYLRQSAALRDLWRDPITVETLDREVARIAAATRFPERLRELFAALGNDPVLVRETFGRASLAGRLARTRYALDRRLHEPEFAEAQTIRDDLSSGRLLPASPHARRAVVEASLESDHALGARGGEIGVIEEDNTRFFVRVPLSPGPRVTRASEYSVPKVSWDDWWERTGPSFDVSTLDATLSSGEREPAAPLPALGAAAPGCRPDETWSPTSTQQLPSARQYHRTVWTGSLMIVWGGDVAGNPVATGSRYDPLTDTWSPTTAVNAPSRRYAHTAVWTGTRMVVWGGDQNPGKLNDGGRYDPIGDTWSPISTAGAPSARSDHVAVWTGSRMVIWGGYGTTVFSDGGLYDPILDQWSPMNTAGAPPGRAGPVTVWTGSRMLVWGGYDGQTYPTTGGQYDPALDQWTGITGQGAPVGRSLLTVVWTGSEAIYWGGWNSILGQRFADGGRYDPVNDTWTPIVDGGDYGRRYRHTAVWTGSAMLVFGGIDECACTNQAKRYDPATDTWTFLSAVNAPINRQNQTAIWTGDRMIVWGGVFDVGFGSTYFDDGGRYDPATDTWTPTSRENVPQATIGTPVWTGNQMLLWLSPGYRYDPLLDDWIPMSSIGAPPGPRSGHSTVWTGREMIVWGGFENNGFRADGGMYDPIADSWRSVPISGATARDSHSAVWTGTRMIIWGGRALAQNGPIISLASGAVFNPAVGPGGGWTNSTSAVNAPSARSGHTAVWAGNRMVVWGGDINGSGGIYDPATNTWTSTSTTNAPSARIGHTLVSTGNEVIVWGGRDVQSPVTYRNDGRILDPGTNTWRPTAGGPLAGRWRHSAIWTGAQMIVWGGDLSSSFTATGARYDPVGETWQPVSPDGAPVARSQHAALWTGSDMIIWGGYQTPGIGINSGGLYALNNEADLDGDGFSVCDGDCDDLDTAVHPGAVAEICDGKDDDCDGMIPAAESDADYDGFRACGGDCRDDRTLVHPGVADVCDGLDTDCDGSLAASELDHDLDGFPACADCNDANPLVRPGVAEACDGVDNDCDALTDEGFSPNTDGDARPDCSDCAPGDAATFAVPGAIADLQVIATDPVAFSWTSQAPIAGSGTLYDVFSGSVSSVRGSGGDYSGGSCTAINLPVAGFICDSPDPPPGEALYFVVRAGNACGRSSFGSPAIDAAAALATSYCP